MSVLVVAAGGERIKDALFSVVAENLYTDCHGSLFCDSKIEVFDPVTLRTIEIFRGH